MGNAMPGLLKAAYRFGPVTVGDVMHRMDADLGADPVKRRRAFDYIIGSGLDVKEPAGRLAHVAGGGLAGHMIASYLGANRFWRNTAAVAGALLGNRAFNRAHPTKPQDYHVI